MRVSSDSDRQSTNLQRDALLIPPEIAAVCEATVDTALIEKHWDTLVHLAASVIRPV